MKNYIWIGCLIIIAIVAFFFFIATLPASTIGTSVIVGLNGKPSLPDNLKVAGRDVHLTQYNKHDNMYIYTE